MSIAKNNHSNDQELSNISKKEWVLLMGFMALAFIIRLFFLRYEYVLSPDGVYYAILGKNLISGNLKDGLSTYWPPLYPLLIGISSFIFQDLEFSGRFTSVLAGSLLVIPVYLLIRNFHGKDVASLGTILIIVYPSLISYSTKVATESTYTLFLMIGILVGWYALSKGNTYTFLLPGLVFGACYLIRPEAIGYMGLMMLLTISTGLIRKPLTFKRILLNNIVLISGFVILALPYILYIHQETGKWTISEKFSANFGSVSLFTLSEDKSTTLADRLYAGSHSIDEHSDSGLKLNPSESINLNLSEIMINSIKGLKYNYEAAIPKTFPIFFIILSAIGLFRTGWLQERASREVYLLLFFISTIIGYSVTEPNPRYLVPQLPILIYWAANGIVELENWFIETFKHLKRISLVKDRRIIRAFIVAVVLFTLMPGITYPMRGNKLDQPIEQKQVALWIKEHAHSRPLIMSTGPWAAFYSGGEHLYLPDEEYSVVIEYARRKNVNYIVIDERLIPQKRSRLQFLLDRESQHPELKLVYRYDKIPDNKILVFELVDLQD